MGGFNIPQGGNNLGMAARGLFSKLFGIGQQDQPWSEKPPVTMNSGWDDLVLRGPAPKPEPIPNADPNNPGRVEPLVNRIHDDPISRNAPMGDSQATTPVGPSAGTRGDDTHLQDMQSEYDKLNAPAPMSLKQRILRGAMGAFMSPQTFRSERQRQLDQQQMQDQQKGRLLQEIEAERRMNTQESLADKRLTLQQQMEQDRFNQQNQMEDRREGARERLDAQTRQASEDRQNRLIDAMNQRQQAQFVEQEKLEGMRETARRASQTGEAAGQRSYQYQSKRVDTLAAPIEQRAERISRLEDTLSQNNPQADALVAPELLTVMAGGQGSGLRMNEAEIARIVGGRSAWENLKANIQHWSTDPNAARSITPAQQQQIRALFGAIKQRVNQKMQVLDEERGNLSRSNDPMEHRQIVDRLQKRLNDADVGGTLKDKIQGGQGGQSANDPLGIR